MPEKLVLTYFETRGRAELARIIMKYGGIEFEDRRIKRDEWERLKPSEGSIQFADRCLGQVHLHQ